MYEDIKNGQLYRVRPGVVVRVIDAGLQHSGGQVRCEGEYGSTHMVDPSSFIEPVRDWMGSC